MAGHTKKFCFVKKTFYGEKKKHPKSKKKITKKNREKKVGDVGAKVLTVDWLIQLVSLFFLT